MSDALLLDLVSSDVDAVRRNVERAAERLRKGDVDNATCADVGAKLRALATHRSPKVRQAVADAALHLADEDFENVVPDLLRDPNVFVKRAAARTFDERSKRRRSEHLRDEQGAHITRLLAAFEKEYGKGARRAADYLCERQTEFFVQKMHHELATVATSLKAALVEIGAQAGRSQIQRERLAEQARAAFGHYELLMAIVNSARSHTELVPPRFEHEPLHTLVSEAVALLRAHIGARAPRLQTDLRVDPGIALDVDRGAMMQAFSNVLQNAVEATPADSTSPISIAVTAKLHKAGTQVQIAFRDNGAGIDQGSLPHVVEPFCSSKPGGRGLGLANVRKMVESVHGGALHLESEPGVGTTVTITLPRKQART